MCIVALHTTLSNSRHRAPNMPYTTNAWSHFDCRFDTLPTHLRRQMWMQIKAQVGSFEMYIVALDITFSISRHRASNMPYTTNAWSHFDRRFHTLPHWHMDRIKLNILGLDWIFWYIENSNISIRIKLDLTVLTCIISRYRKIRFYTIK